jgi:hypothetical protein
MAEAAGDGVAVLPPSGRSFWKTLNLLRSPGPLSHSHNSSGPCALPDTCVSWKWCLPTTPPLPLLVVHLGGSSPPLPGVAGTTQGPHTCQEGGEDGRS